MYGHEDADQADHADDVEDPCIRVVLQGCGRRGVLGRVEGRDLVPERSPPQPGLAGIAVHAVDHAPGVALQMLRGGGVVEVGTVPEEQDLLGVVGLVEPALGQQDPVQRARSRPSSVRPLASIGTGPYSTRGHLVHVQGTLGIRGRLDRRRRGRPAQVARWPGWPPPSLPGPRPDLGRLLLALQRRDDEVVGRVHRDPDAHPLLRLQAARRPVRRWRGCTAGRSRQTPSCRPARPPWSA